MSKLTLVIPCLFGLESIVKNEILKLGYEIKYVKDGRVAFYGDHLAIARANMNVRCGERVLLEVGSFLARSFDELFENVKALPFDEFIGPNNAFPVKGSTLRSKLHSVPDCQSIIKKAAVESLKKAYGLEYFEEDDAKIQIQFSILNDEASIYLDTSGDSLFKRGYRKESGAAPIRETLAAAMVYLSRFTPGVDFYDPFCGSGTIPIECALLSQNIAPGINRNFAFEEWDSLPMGLKDNAKKEALSLIKKDKEFIIFASDIDDKALGLTRNNAFIAGVGENIKVSCRDIKDFSVKGEKGVIVCNPPYGERLLDIKEAKQIYHTFGEVYKNIQNHRLYVIAPESLDFENSFGLGANKKRKVYNGKIRCNIYQYR